MTKFMWDSKQERAIQKVARLNYVEKLVATYQSLERTIRLVKSRKLDTGGLTQAEFNIRFLVQYKIYAALAKCGSPDQGDHPFEIRAAVYQILRGIRQ